MKQHAISAWLLREFAMRSSDGAARLATYSKRTGTYGTDRPDDFMARLRHACAGPLRRVWPVGSSRQLPL